MKTIQLLLTETVDNLGIVGDVVKVRPGYARNYLLPHALATVPTEGAIKRLAARRAQVEAELKARREQLEAILERLKGHEITLQRSANEQGVLFGGVSQHDIGEALRADGFDVDDRAVRLGHTIKRLDSYEIPLALAGDLKTTIKLWVVSDKPMEELETELEAEEAEASAEEEPAVAAAASQAERKEAAKDRKKPRKAKAQDE